MQQNKIKPIIKPRQTDPELLAELEQSGMTPLQSRIVAGRLDRDALGNDPAKLIFATIGDIPKPDHMPDIHKAAARIALAVMRGEVIGLESDFDADGSSAAAIMDYAIVDIFGHPRNKCKHYIANRLEDGYGLSEKLARRILSDSEPPALLITADNGSSDEERVALLKQHNVECIVSDHHAIREGGCPSAYAFVNPVREDSKFDPKVAGCTVAWYLMARTRQVLIQMKHLQDNTPDLGHALVYAGIGTQADCVSLGESLTNRAIMRYALNRMTQDHSPAWQAAREDLGINGYPIRASHISFQIAPKLAAVGRLDESFPGIEFLLAKNITTARNRLKTLTEANEERKRIEKEMSDVAVENAHRMASEGRHAIVYFIENGHPGVQGISASRCVEAVARPAIIFSPTKSDDEITGSCRSVPGINIKEVLDEVNKQHPGTIKKAGGHYFAAGCTLDVSDVSNLKVFADAVEDVIANRKDLSNAIPEIETDGELVPEQLGLNTIDEMMQLEPYGQGFPAPTFHGEFEVSNIKYIGKDKNHISCYLKTGRAVVRGIYFSPPEEIMESLVDGDTIECAYELQENIFRGDRSAQVQVRHVARINGQ